MLDWLSANQSLLIWLSSLSVLIFVASIVALPWLAGMIPEDYFLDNKTVQENTNGVPSFLVLLAAVGRNLLGLLLLCTGILMLFLPGQGLLTIIVSLLLLDYPGKKIFERRIVRYKSILQGINWIRAKGGHSPIRLER
jgi:hypothetical protein